MAGAAARQEDARGERDAGCDRATHQHPAALERARRGDPGVGRRDGRRVADRRGLSVLIGGMCETDYSGYPDCRDNTLKSLQVAISLGLDKSMTIETPLMWLDKAATWTMTEDLGGEALIELVIEHTHSCYLGDRENRHPWGWGCGLCPSCDLRRKGYDTWLAS